MIALEYSKPSIPINTYNKNFRFSYLTKKEGFIFMNKYILCLICFILLFVTACTDKKENNNQNDPSKTNESQFSFGLDVLDKINETTDQENHFISPTSIFIALAMLNHGADGKTKEEIKQTLHLKDFDDTAISESLAALLTKLNESSNDTELHLANSIWLDEQYHIQEDYRKTIDNHYLAKTTEIDATNPASADLINQWVSQQTNEKIKEIIDTPLNDEFVSLLANAVYFKGAWSFPFNEELTEEKDFFLQDGTKIQIPMMTLHEKLSYSKQDKYETVRLPYGENQDMSMYLFLPSEEIGLKEIQRELQNHSIENIKKDLTEKEGTVILPKFTLENEIELHPILKTLGMETAFDKDHANFPHMIEEDNPIWVSKVKHKTYLKIDEKGTEAAGVTSVEIETTSAPLEEPFTMEFNRPFLMLIMEDTTNTPLFIGTIYHPNPS